MSPYELERLIMTERSVDTEKTVRIEYQIYEQLMKKLSVYFIGYKKGLEKQLLSDL